MLEYVYYLVFQSFESEIVDLIGCRRIIVAENNISYAGIGIEASYLYVKLTHLFSYCTQDL